jgi:hypothetical protein
MLSSSKDAVRADVYADVEFRLHTRRGLTNAHLFSGLGFLLVGSINLLCRFSVMGECDK